MPSTLNRQMWIRIQSEIAKERSIPIWVSQVFSLSSEAISRFPSRRTRDEPLAFVAQHRKITESYLEFLQEQIELEPRGKQWRQLLERRLAALQSHKGLKLLMITISSLHGDFYIRLLPPSFTVIHWEVFE